MEINENIKKILPNAGQTKINKTRGKPNNPITKSLKRS